MISDQTHGKSIRIMGFSLLALSLFTLVSCVKELAAVQNKPTSQSASKSAKVPMGTTIAPQAHPKSIEALSQVKFTLRNLNLLDEVPAITGLKAREFSYESEGYTIYGLIEEPANQAPSEGWPVIILAHGYIPTNIYSTSESYRLVTRYYAAGGFMVIKPDYRNHGRSEGNEKSAARTIDYTTDVLNLLSGIKQFPNADENNVFLYGHSMGGEIGLRILEVNNLLRGATIWAGVTQPFPENTLYFIRKRDQDEAQQLMEMIESEIEPQDYASLSPINYLDKIQVPILVHHGTADESVPFEWSIQFRERLNEAGVDYQFFEYPGENHNISESFYKVMDKDMEFFQSLRIPNPG